MPPDAKKIPWYYSPAAIAVTILLVGPLAMPVVWLSPALRRWHKWVITILLIVLSVWLFRVSADLYQTLLKDMQELQKVLKP